MAWTMTWNGVAHTHPAECQDFLHFQLRYLLQRTTSLAAVFADPVNPMGIKAIFRRIFNTVPKYRVSGNFTL